MPDNTIAAVVNQDSRIDGSPFEPPGGRRWRGAATAGPPAFAACAISRPLRPTERASVPNGEGPPWTKPPALKVSRRCVPERDCDLLKHRRRMARYQALLVGRDDPDHNGRVVGADQSLAAVFIACGIENGARPA